MALRVIVLLLAVLVLLPPAALAQSREPRFVGDYVFEGDAVAVAVSQGTPYTALATSQGVTLLDSKLKPLWQKPLISLIGVAITGPDVDRGPWVLAATPEKLYLYDSAGEVRLTSASLRSVRSVGITPDGSRLVVSQERYVEVRDKDGVTVWSKDTGLQQTQGAIGSDGSVATLGSEKATLWTPAGAKSRDISYGDLFLLTDVRRPTSISVSGQEVVIGASDGTYFHDRSGGQQFRLRASSASFPAIVQVSPRIIAISAGVDLTLRDFFGNALKAPSPGDVAAAASLSPDGRHLGMALKQRRLVLYDLGAVVPSFLSVASTPNGTVLVDGETLGTTPFRREIFPGLHQVAVNNTSIGEVPVTVVVPFGGVANVSLNLSRLAYPAALEVNSIPAGADVQVDGSSLGKTPLSLSLTAGNHTLRVALSGFSPYSATLNLTANNLTRLNVTLASGQASASMAQEAIPPNSTQRAQDREATWGVKVVSPPPSASPTPTPEQPGFEVSLALAALLLAGLWTRRRRS